MHFVLVYKWRVLPMVWLMATSACGLMNDDFCLWFDEWRLLSVVWLMSSSAFALINDDFFMCFDWWRFLHVLWLMKTPAKWLIDRFYHQKWRLLPGFWLVGFVPKEWLLRHQLRRYIGSYAHHWFDYWVVCPSLVWLLGRIPVSGMFIGLYPPLAV